MPKLVARDRTIEVNSPLIMGIVNASPDSFSDEGRYKTVSSQIDRAQEVVRAGADIIDIGAQTASTDVPEIDEQEEIDRLMPVLEWTLSNFGGIVSVDTYRAGVAREALSAGAHIINDISSLHDSTIVETIRESRAGYVLMHNVGRPKVLLDNYDFYSDFRRELINEMNDKLDTLDSGGVSYDQVILDPGPDFAKSHAQTIETLQHLEELAALRRPILLPISRKGFIGAITKRPPTERLAGTLGAIGHALTVTRSVIFRVHDVREVRDFINTWDVLHRYRDLND